MSEQFTVDSNSNAGGGPCAVTWGPWFPTMRECNSWMRAQGWRPVGRIIGGVQKYARVSRLTEEPQE